MAMNNVKKATGKFTMKPGSKQVDSPSTFRMDSPLKQLGMMPTGQGSPMMETGPKLEKCHSSDAACLKRNRTARREHSQAAYKARGGKSYNDATLSKGAKAKSPATEKCHSSDAACLKRQREARKKAVIAKNRAQGGAKVKPRDIAGKVTSKKHNLEYNFKKKK